ncbi:MAG: hypothetical protein KA375_02880 [Vitreoscilla sp.]|nr:hypothetical protein [Burkholderiales bacterium]MBP6336514.1 hypothetical protein [Vitreoscilla sp.]
MNHPISLSSALAALTLVFSAGAAQATDVGVSISVNQPGMYGRIDIGQFPQPAVMVAQPVWVQRAPVYAGPPPEPMYLRVPPGHRKNWRRHCGRYNACGAPVYFVREDWYQHNVMRGARPGPGLRQPGWQEERGMQDRGDRGDRGGRGDRGHGHGKGHEKGQRD